MARERMNLFLKVMVAIETSHEELSSAGYLERGPAGVYSRVHHNLIRALHRLIIEEGEDEPGFEAIKASADCFARRN